MNDRSRELDNLIYYFVNDKKVLELINSVSSHTMNDESIAFAIESNDYNSQSITFWDTTKITTMKNMFYNKIKFNELLLWNTNNVTNMSYMFCDARSFNQPLEFNTENVTNMACMFYDMSSFNQPLEFNT